MSSIHKDTYLVVGGGIAGLLSARILAEMGASVTLVERSAELGGLLASRSYERPEWIFDYGTHLPEKLGIPDLDRMLFGRMQADEWLFLPHIKTGNFAFGHLNEASGFINLHALGKELHDAISAKLVAFAEPVAGAEQMEQAAHLQEFITTQYGEEIASYVFAPIMRKFYGVDLAELSPSAHRTFGLTRFLAYDADTSIRLKEHPAVDSRLAFHSSSMGVVDRTSYYPRSGGIGNWTRLLIKDLQELGVRILTNANIASLSSGTGDAKRLRTATLRTGETLEFDHLVWTLPAAFLLRLNAHPGATSLSAPLHSRIALYHFVLDSAPVSKLYYLTCFAPDMHTFRVTMYDNLQTENVNSAHRITVEVLLPKADMVAPNSETILQELVLMGLVDQNSKALAVFREDLPVAFPILTPDFARQSRLARELVENDFDNVTLAGRNGGSVFFMRDVLVDIYDKLSSIRK